MDCVTWKQPTETKTLPYRVPTRGTVRAFDEKYYAREKFVSRGRTGHETPRGTMRTSDQKQMRSPVIKTTVQNLNLDCVKPQRAGVIIYTVIDGATYFGLGLDAKTHDLTDFGGTIYYQYDPDVITGALREFQEETLEIFDPLTREDIKQCPVIYDDSNLIIFVHLQVDPDSACRIFNQKYKSIAHSGNPNKRNVPEVCGITWLTWEEFQQSINEKGVMFFRVQRFLSRADDFSYLL